MSGSSAASVLARGGTVHVRPSLAARFVAVWPGLFGAMLGLRAMDVDRRLGLALLGAVVALAVVSMVLQGRAHVSVRGSELTWRTGFREHRVHLGEVDAPVRARSRWSDRLQVRAGGRVLLTVHGRTWGVDALDRLQQRLVHNARVARPQVRRDAPAS